MDVSPMPVPDHRISPHNPFPPVAHKVWILNCTACDMFLTNRGMKVSLYPPHFFSLSALIFFFTGRSASSAQCLSHFLRRAPCELFRV